MAKRVSVIIPGRCEQYFQKTVESTLDAATGDVEVIAVVDGPGQDPPVKENKRVKVINLDKSIGQRAAYNLGVRESSGEIVGKIDAHAMLSPGFDEAIRNHCPSNAVVLPEMRKLNPHKWEVKKGGKTHFMYFGIDLYCHYWKDYKKRKGIKKQKYPEVMTGQGSCWFTTREWNDYIGLLDEGVGSWGNVGIEVSLRTWLCGGTQIVNKDAWQAHWFRKDDGGFTYPMNGRQVAKAHRYTYENYYFKDDAFKNQVRPFKWLIDKFAPIPSWEAYLVDEYKSPRVILYYTDSKLDETDGLLARNVRKRLKKIKGPIPIISVSQKKLNFGENKAIGEQPRKYKSVYEAIQKGLELVPDGSIVYLIEHDVFYHPSHFGFLPDNKDTMYFNTQRYYYNLGKISFWPARGKRALSQCVAYKEAIQKHVDERLSVTSDDILERWSELEKRSEVNYENFKSERPNVDGIHKNNLTMKGKYKKDYVEDRKKGVFNLPGWGGVKHFQSITGYKEAI